LKRLGKVNRKEIRDIGLHVRIGYIELAGFDVRQIVHGFADGKDHRNQPSLFRP